MERDELVELTRRVLKLVEGRTTDLAPDEYRNAASAYTDRDRWERERDRLFRDQPQLVGYASELPEAGAYVTKEVMGTPVLLVRDAAGAVGAYLNSCRHRGARVADGRGSARRFTCPFHAWTYERDGRLVGVPGDEGFPQASTEGRDLVRLPAEERHGLLWVGLDPQRDRLDVDAVLGGLGPELDSWNLGRWDHVGEKSLEVPLNWKVAVDTFAENYHFATVHRRTFFQIALSNVAAFDAYGPSHRLAFPLRTITGLRDLPEDEWEPLEHLVVIYGVFPNAVMSVTSANGELFRVYPGTDVNRSVTWHQNVSRQPLDDPEVAAGYREVFEYAHATVRDEDYRVAGTVQASLDSGLLDTVVYGRNEPALHRRHASWDAALAS